ncbi:MAG TPA: GGDEF domain-containing protein, partial [Edaphobacter sp.]
MLSAGILLWALGMSLAAWEDISGYISSNVAFFSDLLYLLYGVPILLVITYPAESEITPFFLWLDTIQALMTGCVIYLALFDVMPFGDQPFQQISQSRLIFAYDVENLSLAVLAGLRLLAGSHDRDRMRLLRLLFSFLVVYLLAATAYNHQFSRLSGIMGLYDLLPPTPFLFLGAVVLWPRGSTSTSRQAAHRSFAIWIDNISPAFYTFSLVSIGLTQIRAHFAIGVASIVIAMLVYAVRMAMLQNRYARSQISLRKAKDRLETLSLTDPLTGIPNRRAFDKALNAEWRRAYRLQRPLTLLLIDIDYFKKLNDSSGHTAGDDCLIRVARALHDSLPRSGDMAARYGGEEFAAVL